MRRRFMRPGALIPGTLLAGALLAGPCLWTALAPAAHAQIVNDRVVQGKVELSNGEPAQGAIVYIKNAKTLEVRTYISTADGSYRFAQLSTDADYTLWAEYQGKKSKEKSISSFDNKKVFTIALRIG